MPQLAVVAPKDDARPEVPLSVLDCVARALLASDDLPGALQAYYALRDQCIPADAVDRAALY